MMKNKSALKLANCIKDCKKKKIVEDYEIEEIVHTIPKLSDEETNNIEGKITLEEATRALKSMKNNKSPDTDDFTSEFFWNVLETTWIFCCKITQ